jgi:hypothetical protein
LNNRSGPIAAPALRIELAEGVLEGIAEACPALCFHRFGRRDSLVFARPLELGASNDLMLVPLPPPATYLELPLELGGPFRFALGYVVVLAGRQGPVRAWCPRVRLVHLPEPFPVGRLRAATAAQSPPDVSPEALEGLFQDLSALPAGFSLAEVVQPSRSLLGFRPVAGEAVARPEPRRWPPEHF